VENSREIGGAFVIHGHEMWLVGYCELERSGQRLF